MDLKVGKFLDYSNRKLILILIFYLILGFLLINFYIFIINSDGISYISIAQKYMVGEFTIAFNGYWGPLLSWLLIPFVYMASDSINTIYLTKILQLIIGFFTIIGFKLLSDKLNIEGWTQIIFLVSLIPLILTFSLFLITPDLLIVCCLVFYLNFLFDNKYSYNLRNGLFCGLFGGLAFLTKSYAFLFFILQFTIINILYYIKNEKTLNKKIILKNFLIGLSIFFIISGAWIGTISAKYGYLTIGTTGKYNYELVGPESQGHYMETHGLIEPPNHSAISSWEDPSYMVLKSWSPFTSSSSFIHQLNLILFNFIKIINFLFIYSIFSIFILLYSIIFIIKTPLKSPKLRITYILITILIYSGIYSLILVESRYLWLVSILIMMMGIIMINTYYRLNKLNELKRNFLLALLILSFIIGPIQGLALNYDMNKEIYVLSQTLKDYNVNGKIAANDNWELTIYLAYYLDSKFYGVTINNNDNYSVNNQLIANNIDYYFVWGKNGNLQLSDYIEIYNISAWNLKIFTRIKN